MHKGLMRLVGILISGAMVIGVAGTALAAEAGTQSEEHKPTAEQRAARKALRELLEQLRPVFEAVHAARQEMKDELTELRRLVSLAKEVEKTDALKAAFAEVKDLREEIKAINVAYNVLREERQALRAVIESKDPGAIIAAAARLKGDAEAYLRQLKTGYDRIEQVVEDLAAALKDAGVNV